MSDELPYSTVFESSDEPSSTSSEASDHNGDNSSNNQEDIDGVPLANCGPVPPPPPPPPSAIDGVPLLYFESVPLPPPPMVTSDGEPIVYHGPIVPPPPPPPLHLIPPPPPGFTYADLLSRRAALAALQNRIAAATASGQLEVIREWDQAPEQASSQLATGSGGDSLFYPVSLNIVDAVDQEPVAPAVQLRSILSNDSMMPMVSSSDDTSNSEDERVRQMASGETPQPLVVHRVRFALDEVFNISSSSDSSEDTANSGNDTNNNDNN